jgi:aerobic-type carbon monoxide dehydrogenase small subunit (CoxS/CutS family)
MEKTIRFTLNGKTKELKVDTDRPLLWVLRTDCALTGTKYGCGEGLCGACTVLLDDDAVRSCQTTVGEVAGRKVTTIEGLAARGELHPLQKAFAGKDALQCGYCTSGMIMNAYALLKKTPSAPLSDVIDGMENNLCRCGAHKRIVEALEAAAAELRGGM